jgi:hypothetical protein
LVGGILALGLGSLIARLGQGGFAIGTRAAAERAETIDTAGTVVAATAVAENHTDIFAGSAPYVPPAPKAVEVEADDDDTSAIGSVRDLQVEAEKPIVGTRFRMPNFPKRPEFTPAAVELPDPVVVPPAPVYVAPEPVVVPPSPTFRPLQRATTNASAVDEVLAKVPQNVRVTTRHIVDSSERHLLPNVIVRHATPVAAATAGAVVGGTSAESAASRSVAETLDALEQAKTEIRTAFNRTDVQQSVVDNNPGPEDEYEDDQVEDVEVVDESEIADGELYVVEELTVRGRPARVLSDGTVEAETDEGWMRFENMDHLNEYLDA